MNINEPRQQAKAARNGILAALLTTPVLALNMSQPLLAQGSPLPGGAPAGGSSYGSSYGAGNAAGESSSYSGAAYSAPAPAASASAPVPGSGQAAATPATKRSSKYRELPITVDSAKYRLDELRGMLATARPQEMQDSVQELCEWLTDAADAHYRMYVAFTKSDLTKPQANSEKQLNQNFSQLKREAQLLRADLLIKQMRAPEALAPLVDIVVADPRSNTGKEAYKRLVELGFSQAIAAPVAAAGEGPVIYVSEPVPVKAPPTAPVKAPATAAAPAAASHKEVKVQATSQTTKPLR